MNDLRLSQPSDGTLIVAHLVYALHSLSIIAGALSAATIVGAFVFSIPSIIAVVLNYLIRHDADGTYAASHFAWQIETFWGAFLWGGVVTVLGFLLSIVVVGVFILWGGYLVLAVWVVYRIARGWICLFGARPVVR